MLGRNLLSQRPHTPSELAQVPNHMHLVVVIGFMSTLVHDQERRFRDAIGETIPAAA